jgi:hypothetical protein
MQHEWDQQKWAENIVEQNEIPSKMKICKGKGKGKLSFVHAMKEYKISYSRGLQYFFFGIGLHLLLRAGAWSLTWTK